MVPYVITLDQVKAYLGIEDTAQDAQLSLFIPAVSDAVINYLNKEYLSIISGTISDLSAVITEVPEHHVAAISAGDIIESSAFTSGVSAATVVSVDRQAGTITMSEEATADYSGYIDFRSLPVGAKPTVSQMVLFRMIGGSVSGATNQMAGGVTSRKYGPISVNFGSDATIGASGFPKGLESGLWDYKRPRFA